VEFQEAWSASRPNQLTLPIANLRLPIGFEHQHFLFSDVRINALSVNKTNRQLAFENRK
jgi:hypothetical protein